MDDGRSEPDEYVEWDSGELDAEEFDLPEKPRFTVARAIIGLVLVCALLAYFIVPIRTSITIEYQRLIAPLVHPIPVAPKPAENPKRLV